ncbi:MAG: Sua5/YciO/YrdC/YwlC family protein [Phaeodactylibacter sp.]|nr:Sua5/YciO/YrdC/YwlC family protein [Phaeodactylibacter sp.]
MAILFNDTVPVSNSHPCLEDALQVLESGGLILYPTDTIWAIGCDATNAAAIQRIYELKQRSTHQPLISLVGSMQMLRKFVPNLHPRLETLLHFHFRPLTLVYDQVEGLPLQSRAQDGSVAFRIPQDNFCRELVNRYGKPIIATAAHVQHERIPQNFGEISSTILEGVDLVIKYRQKDRHIGEPSVIARLSVREELEFIRE